MAEDNLYASPELISLYCYVNKETDTVEAILSFDIFGIGSRLEGVWKPISRTDPDLLNYLNSGTYRVFKIDWDKEPITGADPADESAWDHQLVQAWDNEETLMSGDLDKYAHEINVELEEDAAGTAEAPKE